MEPTQVHKLTRTEAKAIVASVEQWFQDHPLSKVCKTNIGVCGFHTFHRKNVIAQVSKLTQ